MATPSAQSLLERGYLPEELPPPFTSAPYAKFSSKNVTHFASVEKDPHRLKGVDYSATKAGYRRRLFTIPHPISQFFVCKFISENWAAIEAHYKKSKFSVSVPLPSPDEKARSITITPFNELNSLIHTRLGQFEFIVKSDIQRFYPSIYTHSIPWAVHSKAAAKADGKANSATVTFNKLDKCIQRGQDGQTIGIPIGPDTSRIVGEIIASAIDAHLAKAAGARLCACVRHVDDFYIASKSREDAEACIAALRMALREFGLEINEQKTAILQSSAVRDDAWPRRLIKLLNSDDQGGAELYEIFEDTFEMASDLKSDAPVRFLLRWGDRNTLFDDHWEILENFFVKCLIHHPHTIDHVARIVVSRKLFDDDLDEKKWTGVVLNQLRHHLDMGHDHEICWLLWIVNSLSVKLSDDISAKLIEYPNAVVALMGMHARTLGLIKKSLDISTWTDRVGIASFDGDWWLFAYECSTKGWVKNKVDWTTIKGSIFERMKNAKVTFYRSSEKSEEVAQLKKGKPAIPKIGFGYDEDEENWDDFDDDEEDDS